MDDLVASRVGLDVVETGKGVGAEVRGIDLRTLDDRQFDNLHQAWLDNLVLLVRNQSLSDADLIAFSRRFGDLDLAPVQETGRRMTVLTIDHRRGPQSICLGRSTGPYL